MSLLELLMALSSLDFTRIPKFYKITLTIKGLICARGPGTVAWEGAPGRTLTYS